MNIKGKVSKSEKTSFLITILGMFMITIICTFNMFTFEYGNVLSGADKVLYLFSISMVLIGLICKNTDGNKYLKAATWMYVIGGVMMYVLSVMRLFFDFNSIDDYGIDRVLNMQHISLLLTTAMIFAINILAVWLVMKVFIPLDKKHVKEESICRQFYVSGLAFVILKTLSVNSKLLLDTTFTGVGLDYNSFSFISLMFNILYIIACVWFIYATCKMFLSLLVSKKLS